MARLLLVLCACFLFALSCHAHNYARATSNIDSFQSKLSSTNKALRRFKGDPITALPLLKSLHDTHKGMNAARTSYDEMEPAGPETTDETLRRIHDTHATLQDTADILSDKYDMFDRVGFVFPTRLFLSSFIQEKNKLRGSIENKAPESNLTAIREAFSDIDSTCDAMFAMYDS